MDGVSEKLTDIFWEYIIDGVALPLTVVEDETSPQFLSSIYLFDLLYRLGHDR